MAIFVFLAAAARTRVVSPDFLFRMYRCRFALVGLACCRSGSESRSLQFVYIHLCPLLAFALNRLRILLLDRDIGLVEYRKDVAIDLFEHLREEVVRLELVNQQRVFLLVRSVLHALAQIVHFAQMFAPSVVDGGKHHHFREYFVNLCAIAVLAALQIDRNVIAEMPVCEREVDVAVHLLLSLLVYALHHGAHGIGNRLCMPLIYRLQILDD